MCCIVLCFSNLGVCGIIVRASLSCGGLYMIPKPSSVPTVMQVPSAFIPEYRIVVFLTLSSFFGCDDIICAIYMPLCLPVVLPLWLLLWRCCSSLLFFLFTFWRYFFYELKRTTNNKNDLHARLGVLLLLLTEMYKMSHSTKDN